MGTYPEADDELELKLVTVLLGVPVLVVEDGGGPVYSDITMSAEYRL